MLTSAVARLVHRVCLYHFKRKLLWTRDLYLFALAAGLDKLAALEFLDVRANQISNIDDVASIANVSPPN
jgi:hypothetical protein